MQSTDAEIPTILEAAEAFRAGTLRPTELVERCLARIGRWEGAVRAWVLVDEEGARRQARVADEALAAGRDAGPLLGIPIGIKDLVDVRGWPTRAGSALTSDRPADEDATVAARLRRAGAVFLGKTVTTEFASFDPPPTANPWDLQRTPGGSSSGSAAAAALGMCLGAIGSQTGGSITRPASYCGVAGLKPTYGRVSLAGIVPLAYGLDHPGPIARTVADLAVLLAAIAGPDPRDPLSSPAPAADYVAAVRGPRNPPRLGLVEDYFLETAEPPVRRVVEAALERLRVAGAEIVPARLPASFGEVVAMHRRLMAAGAADFHRRWFPARRGEYGPRIAQLLDEGLALAAIDYAQAAAHQQRFAAEMAAALAGADALVMPATPDTAPGRQSTGDPRFNSPWSYSHLPVASLPCGLAEDGMPVAVQLVGRPMEEANLLAAAAWCEEVFAFGARPGMMEGRAVR
jgi:aspartyl-tRNA(Asn)/glutamyl-tRNA(Gln) amidotransferase subunit A